MTQKIVLTPEGQSKLLRELEELRTVRRPQVAERIKTAKEFGDLSENAEYHEAKDEQGFIEGRISEIDQILKIAHVVDKKGGENVSVGSKVVLEAASGEVAYEVVGATEADPLAGKISLESPLGDALLDKKVGESVDLVTPNGNVTYIIKKIE